MISKIYRYSNAFLKKAKINSESLKVLENMITDDNNPKIFFTMTEINKIGINPQTKWHTPVGVYCYPLTDILYKKLIEGNLPFAGKKPYINIFTLSKDIFNLSNYTEVNLQKDINKLKKIYDFFSKEEFEEIVNKSFKTAYTKKPVSLFWNLTRIISGNVIKWNKVLRDLDYTNFYDPGIGIIHSNEPNQCIILDPRIIVQIDTFYNPNYSKTENLPQELLNKEKNIKRKKQYIFSENASGKTLDMLARNENYLMKLYIVSNPNTLTSTLDFLAKEYFSDDSSYEKDNMYEKILKNKNTSVETLDYLAQNANPYQMIYVINHPNATEEIKNKALKRIKYHKSLEGTELSL